MIYGERDKREISKVFFHFKQLNEARLQNVCEQRKENETMCGEIDAKGQAMDAAFCFTQGAVRGEKDCQLRKRKKETIVMRSDLSLSFTIFKSSNHV